MRYTFESVKAVTTVAPISATAGAITGTTVDTRGFGDGMAVISVGATSGTPDSFTVAAKLQESADDSTWSDISGATITTVTAANKTAEIKIELGSKAASKRYVRAVVTPAFVNGTTPKVGVSAVIVLGQPERGSKAANSGVGN